MEVDNMDDCNGWTASDHMKAFEAAADKFESTHSEASLNRMNLHLNLLTSTCDLSIFSPETQEVRELYFTLSHVMGDPGGPHWAGVALLSRACDEPSALYFLTHYYPLLPVLTKILSSNPTNERKIKLLSIMQSITYGIQIRMQRPCLLLMKILTDYITKAFNDTEEEEEQLVAQKAISILANVCSSNYDDALMKTVNISKFAVDLINSKVGLYCEADVLRIALCLLKASVFCLLPQAEEVHAYFSCGMRNFKKAILEKDEEQLLQVYLLMKQLCDDASWRKHVAGAPTDGLEDALKHLVDFCNKPDVMEENKKPAVVKNALKVLTVLVNLDVDLVCENHYQMLRLCLVSHRICLPESMELLSNILLQYKDEGRLPEELIFMIDPVLPELLVPPSALEQGKAGFQWLKVVGALCELDTMKERVLPAVAPEAYEEIFYSVCQHSLQDGYMGAVQGQQAAVLGLRTALCLAPAWAATLKRLLLDKQVRQLLSEGLVIPKRRAEILDLTFHPSFPFEQLYMFSTRWLELVDGGYEPQHKSTQTDGPKQSSRDVGVDTEQASNEAVLEPSATEQVRRLFEKQKLDEKKPKKKNKKNKKKVNSDS